MHTIKRHIHETYITSVHTKRAAHAKRACQARVQATADGAHLGCVHNVKVAITQLCEDLDLPRDDGDDGLGQRPLHQLRTAERESR